MHGLVTLLPEPFYSKVNTLWDGLETEFGLNGIRVTPYPHFSWNIAERYRRPSLDLVLAEIAAESSTIPVQIDGIGLFAAPRPVLFLKVLRNPDLNALHARLWENMQRVADGLSEYYSPEQWQQHVSLAYGDLESEQVPEVRTWLEAQEAYDWDFKVDNICYIYEPEGQVGDLQISVPLRD
jgi:2'-5' RNA ligase